MRTCYMGMCRWNRFWTKQSQCQCGAWRGATVGHLRQWDHRREENKPAAFQQRGSIWPQQVSECPMPPMLYWPYYLCSKSINGMNDFVFFGEVYLLSPSYFAFYFEWSFPWIHKYMQAPPCFTGSTQWPLAKLCNLRCRHIILTMDGMHCVVRWAIANRWQDIVTVRAQCLQFWSCLV